MQINLVALPFHDYKVAIKEGFRTRDTHLYEHFMQNINIDKVIIINRPTSFLELALFRKQLRSPAKMIYYNKRCVVSEINKKNYVIDLLDFDILGPVIKKHAWIPTLYSKASNINAIKKALSFLQVSCFSTYLSSPLSVEMSIGIGAHYQVLDAVDNLIKHTAYEHCRNTINTLYDIAKVHFDKFYVNSNDSYQYFNGDQSKKIELLPNGVDFSKFQVKSDIPKDLVKIKKPIIGYAGKIQNMFDLDLYRKCVDAFPNANFVVIGKILEHRYLDTIKSKFNVHYLGDKKYSQLPAYINHFDICCIPYKREKQHGGDPIKFYEYMAANKPIVSTDIGLISKYHDSISRYVVSSHDDFISALKNLLHKIPMQIKNQIPFSMTWKYKSDYIVNNIIKNFNLCCDI